jgi:hypothetical protein
MRQTLTPAFPPRPQRRPKRGCESSQFSSRGEDRAKHAVARMRNGVVGSTGRKCADETEGDEEKAESETDAAHRLQPASQGDDLQL